MPRSFGAVLEITVDGRPVPAQASESLAMALGAAGITSLRRSPESQFKRGAFCLMGVCQECVVAVDGVLVPACMEPVRAGMKVSLDVLENQREEVNDA
jgi:D-hydroxyproline dehydrogenase subunit gamma